MKVNIILAILLYVLSLECSAGMFEGKGETVLPFLRINPSVRSAGFGGSNAATIEGVQAIYLNPAGIAAVNKTDIYMQYTRWIDEINIGYISLASKFDKWGILGFSAGYMMYPKQKETKQDSSNPYNYVKIDEFSASTGFIGGYFSKKLGTKIMSGFGVKGIGQKIGDFKSIRTIAMDMGFIIIPNSYTRYGFSANNLSWGVKYGSELEPMPIVLRLGGEWNYDPNAFRYIRKSKGSEWKYSFKLCSEFRLREGIYVKGGIEVFPFEFLSLGLGYTYALEGDDLKGIGGASAGFGLINIGNMKIDYAINSYGRLGIVHRAGINFSI